VVDDDRVLFAERVQQTDDVADEVKHRICRDCLGPI
jgi:hypothetical protein